MELSCKIHLKQRQRFDAYQIALILLSEKELNTLYYKYIVIYKISYRPLFNNPIKNYQCLSLILNSVQNSHSLTVLRRKIARNSFKC